MDVVKCRSRSHRNMRYVNTRYVGGSKGRYSLTTAKGHGPMDEFILSQVISSYPIYNQLISLNIL